VSKVISFYEDIFDWKIMPDLNGLYKIFNSKDEYISDMLEIQNQYKGNYEYWVCTFGVDNLNKTKQQILKHGGHLISDENHRMMFTDNSNEAFFYIKQV